MLNTVEPALKVHPIGHTYVVSQYRWSFGDRFNYIEM